MPEWARKEKGPWLRTADGRIWRGREAMIEGCAQAMGMSKENAASYLGLLEQEQVELRRETQRGWLSGLFWLAVDAALVISAVLWLLDWLRG